MAYEEVNRKALWEELTLYGLHGRHLIVFKSFYHESRACMRESDGMSERYEINRMSQGCLMSTWLFNIFYGWGIT